MVSAEFKEACEEALRAMDQSTVTQERLVAAWTPLMTVPGPSLPVGNLGEKFSGLRSEVGGGDYDATIRAMSAKDTANCRLALLKFFIQIELLEKSPVREDEPI
jgi:hypothetical protein